MTWVFIQDRGEKYIYDGTPSAASLIASHCPDGPAIDLYGTLCPAGDWCADGYELVRQAEVWPGVMLRQREVTTP